MKGRILNIVLVLVLAALPMAANAGWSEAQQVTDQPAPAQVEETPASDADFNSSPVMFIENVGQWDDGARFQVWGGPAGTMWLAEDAIWITVVEPGGTSRQEDKALDPLWPSKDQEDLAPRRGVNITLSFVGANPHPRIETFDRLDTTVSYFYGNDPDQWRPDVPVWGGVRYVDLYPGIDLELTQQEGQMTPRLAVRPGADLSAVQLRVEGAEVVAVDGDRLRLSTAVGDVVLPLLLAVGSNGGTTVQARSGRTFDVSTPFAALSSTLHSPPVTPDSPADNPADLLYSTFLGGSDGDVGHAIAVDETGNAYVGGATYSTNFPVTPGVFDPSHNGGNEDTFVAKLNSVGSELVYATFLGGSGQDYGRDIALDNSGSAYVTGWTDSGDFPTTAGAFDPTYNGTFGYSDAFVVKLNPTGSGLNYATYLGSHHIEQGFAIAVDRSGSAYVTGTTWSGDFPTTPGAFDPTINGNGWSDAFVTKLNPTGSGLTYSTFLGGWSHDYGFAIAVDETDSAYVTGWTPSNDFPSTPGAFDPIHGGSNDVFVAKLNPAGSELAYATFLGGSGDDAGSGIVVDGAGSAYVTGNTNSSDFPTTAGAFDPSYNGGGSTDAFVAKLNPTGSGLAYATFLGSISSDSGNGIAVDRVGSACVTGFTASNDFPTTPDAFDRSHNGVGDDAFVVRLNPAGSELAYGTFLGGSSSDNGLAIAVDATGNVYVTGHTYASDFPTTPGAFDTSHNGNGYIDAFVAKLDAGGYVSGPRTDPNNSFINVTPVSLPADGVTTATVTVQLLSAMGEPSWGKTVRLTSSRGSMDTIAQPALVTNGYGITTGTVRSSTAGAGTISAFVFDDGVLLSPSANLTFQPYTPANGAFLFELNHLTDRAIDGLTWIRDDAQAIANDGDYFRGAIGADAARLAADVVFGMADVVGGMNQIGHLQKAARLACPGCYVPGTWNVQFSYDHPAAARLLDLGFMRLEEASASQIAEFIGWGGPQFYGKILNAGTRYITKEVAKEATRSIFLGTSSGMSSVAYPAVRDSANDLATLIERQRDNLLANLPAMTPADQSAYQHDLNGRSHALLILGQQLDDERMTLANFRQIHGQQGSPMLNFLLRFTAKSLAKGFLDGPGTVAVGGALTFFDGYMDRKRLSESMQMYDLAMGTLLGGTDALRQTYHTAYRGLDRIARGLPGDRALGQISSVTHFSQGSGWGSFWHETASWSEVSLTNTGSSETTFRVLSEYLADTTRFGLPWATMNLVEEVSITLAPNETGSVRVDYKRADGTKGFSPRSETCLPVIGCVPASSISIDVLGTNSGGTYFIDHHDGIWDNTRVTLAGVRAPMHVQDLPAIDPPLTSYVLSAPWTQVHEAQLWISNPFTTAVPATITQVLPNNVIVVNTGGGIQTGNNLTWNTMVEPSALSMVSFTFDFPASPSTSNAMQPAVLSLQDPRNGQLLTVNSNPVDFYAIWPLTLDYATLGYVLPGIGSDVTVTMTNWLADAQVEGTLDISVTDTWSTTVHIDSQSFSIPPGATGTVAFTLPTTLTSGDYIVHGRVASSGAEADVFADRLQVGVPGPLLDYRSSPLGAVYPADTVTYTVQFTNTIGVPLNQAVLSASLPLSSTVFPGSVTGGGTIEPDSVRWNLGTVAMDQAVVESFVIQVDSNAAVPGVTPGRLLSEAYLSANEIEPTWGPAAWNLVSLCGLLLGDVNCTCAVDVNDLVILASTWPATQADPTYVPLYDVVPNGRIDIADIQNAASNWLLTCP